ncbi:MAG TPA: rhodanese-like domain-containing protein [Solirubrobacteraceae bacterium]
MNAAQTSDIAIDPARVAEWLQDDPTLQLIDVREPYEREAGHIAGSRHIELARLPSEAATLDRERPVVFYCRVGSRSMMAAQALRASGIDAYSMDGGLVRWAAEQRALEPDGGYVADH